MDIQDMTTKGTTTMVDRYRRIRREIQEDQGEENEGGFTLIELLIVIVVLGILAAVTVFGLSNLTSQSLTSACRADAKSVGVAQEAFRAQTPGSAPAFAPNIAALVTGGYLRSDASAANAANATHYSIQTDTSGAVFVFPGKNGVPPPPYSAANNFDTTPTICDGLS